VCSESSFGFWESGVWRILSRLPKEGEKTVETTGGLKNQFQFKGGEDSNTLGGICGGEPTDEKGREA